MEDEVLLDQTEISGRLSGTSDVGDVVGRIPPRVLSGSCRSFPHLGEFLAIAQPNAAHGDGTMFPPLSKCSH
jgi:hypothetical protein